MTWWDYVVQMTGGHNGRTGESHSTIGYKIGAAPTTVTRWPGQEFPNPRHVQAFAAAYGRPLLEACIAAGFLTEMMPARSSAARTRGC